VGFLTRIVLCHTKNLRAFIKVNEAAAMFNSVLNCLCRNSEKAVLSRKQDALTKLLLLKVSCGCGPFTCYQKKINLEKYTALRAYSIAATAKHPSLLKHYSLPPPFR
jgi:hypothetical protein